MRRGLRQIFFSSFPRECRGPNPFLRLVSADAPGKAHILRHDGGTLGVDRAEVRVFEKTDHECLGGFLEAHECGRLKPEVRLEFLGDFAHEALKGQLFNVIWLLICKKK